MLGSGPPRPVNAKVTETCPTCGGDIWLKKPSQPIYCGVCGAPYRPQPVVRTRP